MIANVDEFTSVNSLLFKLDDKLPEQYDIVFLDVLMPESNGINAGRSMRTKGFTGAIVYVSRSREYAISAFDVDAFNYVLKEDNGTDRLNRVVSAALAEAQKNNQRVLLVSNIHERRNIPIDSISYFEIYGRTVTVHYGINETFEFLSSMERVEAQTGSYGFIRIQRSFLVNLAAVQSYNAKEVSLYSGVLLPIGRSRWGTIRPVLEKQCGGEMSTTVRDSIVGAGK